MLANLSAIDKIGEAIPIIYGALQFFPLLRLELSELSQTKLMRQANISSTRQAQLSPRRLFDFISPRVFALAVSTLFVTIFLDFYWHQFNVSWGHESLKRAITLVDKLDVYGAD